jgi:hypothetical protein
MQKQTPETVGNQFGYLCPKCGKGDWLHVTASVSVTLVYDGTEDDDGCREWDDDSPASCGNCAWDGQVKDLKRAKNFEGE